MGGHATVAGSIWRYQTISGKKTVISTRPKLLFFFDDSQKLNHLKIELAAVVDWGEPFVKATYKLESNGPLAFTCYEAIQEVVTSIKVAPQENVADGTRLMSIMLLKFPIILSGNSFFLTDYSQNYSYNSPLFSKIFSQFTHPLTMFMI